ncbi:MAG: ABC transporter substrate-binding protein [Gammaproteobacteria bacterium]|nr:ABC transporter substrate-binding protein [Gammaproteobacteria bacterium]
MASDYGESPALAKLVQAGQLPSVADRLPEQPLVTSLAKLGRKPGKFGGTLRFLMGRSKDVRLMVVYGYARLVGYDDHLALQPDILRAITNEQNRIFTLHLRKGHRWSDGAPFTSADFAYYWHNIANNKELSPFGLSQELLVDGKGPTFEVIDEVTVRYSWDKPNPFFLPALAGTRPLYVFAPAHFLRQFHIDYEDPEKLAERAKAAGLSSWAALHNRMDSPYKNRVPTAPSLQPWVNTTPEPALRFVFERNAFFHRVDEAGRQLPYIDRVVLNIVDKKLVPAKTGAGETDLQARAINFSDFTFLKRNEKRNNFRVALWTTTKGAHIALFPNLNAKDPQWRKLFQDVRFRRALSLGIDRHEINQVIYLGFATEGNNAVHKKSPLYKDVYRSKWASFDLQQANALLDRIGLTKRGDNGLRLLPDGRPMEIVVETAGESTEQVDVLELIHDSWKKLGIKLFTKPIQREVFRNRVFSGATLVSVWGGFENGVPTTSTSPDEFAPTSQQQLQWPKWGQHYQDKGAAGAPPELASVKELLTLHAAWAKSASEAEQARIWHRMLELHADGVFTIGIVAAVPQPVVVQNKVQNVPEKGIYNWEPGAHFGIYRMDTFWIDQ